jgi:hypothetical protein
MDVGVTRSEQPSPFHYFTGTIVFFITYSAVLLAMRQWFI